MACIGKGTIEVEFGPTFRAAMDVLELACDLAEAIPDYVPEREELHQRTKALAETMLEYAELRRRRE